MRMVNRTILYLLVFPALLVFPKALRAQSAETGVASYYHDKFEGRLTANGERFTQSGYTAAHKCLPLGTWVKITNLGNDSTVIVKINDRMPPWNRRAIDLTKTAAAQLGYLHNGLARVRIEIVPDPHILEDSLRAIPLPLNEMTTAVLTKISCSKMPVTIRTAQEPAESFAYTEPVTEKKKFRLFGN